MGKVISVANTKGGEGKTTFARNLVMYYEKADYQTLALDADEQKSMYLLFEQRTAKLKNLNIHYSKDMEEKIISYSKAYDITIIDVGGRETNALRSVLLASDSVIIPVGCGQESLNALSQMMAIVEEIKTVNKDLKVAIFLSRAPNNVRDMIADGVLELIKGQYEDVATILENRIRDRKSWLTSSFGGFAIWETRSNKAFNEFNNVVGELIEKEII